MYSSGLFPTCCSVYSAKLLQLILTLCDPRDCSPLWDSPGKNTGVGCHALPKGIFLTQGWNPHLLSSCIANQILYHYCHLGSPSFFLLLLLLLGCFSRVRLLCDPIDSSPPGSPIPGIL